MRRSPAERLSLAVLTAILLAYSLRLSADFGKSSDQANLLLAGLDMLHGNWRLRGWSMVADSYWTLDVAFGAVLTGLRWLLGRPEISPTTLVIEPALSWTALCVAAILAAQSWAMSATRRWSACLVGAATLAVPVMRPDGVTPLVFLSGIHILTILCALLAFLAAEAALAMAASWWPIVACAGFVLLGVVGDPLMLFICVGPLLLSLVLTEAAPRRRRAALASCVGLAVVAGKLAVLANTASGGFTVGQLPLEFAAFSELGANLAATLHGLLAVFSADFTGRTVADAVPDLVHLPLLILIVLTVAGVLVARCRLGRDPCDAPADLLTLCLVLGFVVDVAALLLSRRVEYEASNPAVARYLFPAWVFGSVLLARLAAHSMLVRLLSAAALAGALLFNSVPLRQTRMVTLSPGETLLLETLQAQPVHVGFAGYWQAGLLQVASGNRIRLHACVADAAGRLVPMRNVNHAFRVSDSTSQDFLVVVSKPKLYFGRDDVERSFGVPSRSQDIPGFTILFYAARPG